MIYTEEYLASQFTFGFEFEGFSFDEENYNNFERLVSRYFSEHKLKNDKSIFNTYSNLDDDSSIEPEYSENYTFEYASPTFYFTPKNLERTILFLTRAFKFTQTNTSCSLHIHIGFPDKLIKIDENRMWIILCLANDLEFVSNLSNFQGFELYDDHYAPIGFLFSISEHLRTIKDNSDLKRIVSYFFTGKKFIAFGQHAQGTLEWRGPRAFLDEQDPRLVKDFFIRHLYPFIKWIGKSLELESIKTKEGYIINRSDVFKYVSESRTPISNQRKKTPFMQKFTNSVDVSLLGEVVKKHKGILTGQFLCSQILKDINTFIFSFMRVNSLDISDCTIQGGRIEGGNFKNIFFESSMFSISDITSTFLNCNIKCPINDAYYIDSFIKANFEKCNIINYTLDEVEQLSFTNCNLDEITIKDMINSDFKICNLNINFLSKIENVTFSNCDIKIKTIENDTFHAKNKILFKNITFNNCIVHYKDKSQRINGIIIDIKDFKGKMGITNENNEEMD